MGFLEDRDLSNVPTIPEFYKGKTILITGGTGFMGQVLIEKLLYSCSDIKEIILVIRYKKGATLDKRLADLYASSAFGRLKKEKPTLYELKVKAFHGDVTKDGLDLSIADKEYIKENVNIIFHAAASVRFNDDLPTATNTNIKSARELISLAKEMKNLVAYVHVSTCYSNTNYGSYIEEKLYPPHADWRDTIEICDNIDKDTIEYLRHKYIGKIPNTYVFTKQLAEHLVSEERGKLPIIIIRPSIVVSAAEEPAPGWISTFNGPVGLCVGYAKGVLKDILCHDECFMDYVPVDISIKHFLAAAWIRGTKPLEQTDDVEIYQCSSKDDFLMNAAVSITAGARYVEEYPTDNCIWPPSASLTRSPTLHYFKVLVYQLLPAIFFDFLLWVLGKETILVRIQRKIRQVDMALEHYLTNEWRFENKNSLSLLSSLKEQDRRNFDFNLKRLDTEEYLKNVMIGGKIFLLNESLDDVPKARRRLFWMKVMAYTVKTILFCFVAWKIFNTSYVQNYYQSIRL